VRFLDAANKPHDWQASTDLSQVCVTLRQRFFQTLHKAIAVFHDFPFEPHSIQRRWKQRWQGNAEIHKSLSLQMQMQMRMQINNTGRRDFDRSVVKTSLAPCEIVRAHEVYAYVLFELIHLCSPS
jgi:hypothetical protein